MTPRELSPLPEDAQRLRARVLPAITALREGVAVASEIADDELLANFLDTVVPPGGVGIDAYAEFLTQVVPHCINNGSPRCWAHMAGTPPRVLATLAEIVVLLNQNMVKRDASRAFSLLERQTLAILHRLVFGRDDRFYETALREHRESLGLMSSGGSLANLGGLWCARNAALPAGRGFAGVEHAGLAAGLLHHGLERAVVLASELAHYSVPKSAAMLGLGTSGFMPLAVDRQGRVVLAALERELRRCRERAWKVIAVVAVAGTTSCGSFDPIDDMASVAEAHGAWLHVDAAWGASSLFHPALRQRAHGIARAHTVALDAHKQLNVPVGAGMLLLRDPDHARLIEKTADYALQEDTGDLGKVSVEGSRPASALMVHAALQLMGLEGFARLAERSEDNARRLAERIRRDPAFELLLPAQTGIVLYRYLPESLRGRSRLSSAQRQRVDRLNRMLQDAQMRRGRSRVAWTHIPPSMTACGERTLALRAVVANPAIGEADFDAVLREQRELGDALDAACAAGESMPFVEAST